MNPAFVCGRHRIKHPQQQNSVTVVMITRKSAAYGKSAMMCLIVSAVPYLLPEKK